MYRPTSARCVDVIKLHMSKYICSSIISRSVVVDWVSRRGPSLHASPTFRQTGEIRNYSKGSQPENNSTDMSASGEGVKAIKFIHEPGEK